MFSCETCSFDTNHQGNLNRHLNTSKHNQMIELFAQMHKLSIEKAIDKMQGETEESIIEKLKYRCKKCGYRFANSSGRSLHQNTCKNINIYKKKIIKPVTNYQAKDVLDNHVDIYKDQLKEKDHEIEKLKYEKEIERLKRESEKKDKEIAEIKLKAALEILEKGQVNNNVIINGNVNNNITFKVKYLKRICRPPAAQKITEKEVDDFFSKRGITTNTIINHFKAKTLEEHISNLLIDAYWKPEGDKISLQPLWATDVSRGNIEGV